MARNIPLLVICTHGAPSSNPSFLAFFSYRNIPSVGHSLGMLIKVGKLSTKLISVSKRRLDDIEELSRNLHLLEQVNMSLLLPILICDFGEDVLNNYDRTSASRGYEPPRACLLCHRSPRLHYGRY
ncbi:hypothetical protein P154DRAFT_128434 [Amniculicola lignicola CBS 123094]|uniref:Uncharacterized protein n=1 Tax=Amniculicola lignicola CBS 123094 TaxID=1392246 RepID=A0A6A5WQB0_9PLEO|nr:hypothetical protein P154DRAFT_128434 [Amniculicola lignicola CBS 123094]